jgi:hypothetical protein
MARRQSPQEKKIRAYQHDRRNVYGENDKASRKSIRAQKAARSRRPRRLAKKELRFDRSGLVKDDYIVNPRSWSWKKYPDEPVGLILEHRQTIWGTSRGGRRLRSSRLRAEALNRLRKGSKVDVSIRPPRGGDPDWARAKWPDAPWVQEMVQQRFAEDDGGG